MCIREKRRIARPQCFEDFAESEQKRRSLFLTVSRSLRSLRGTSSPGNCRYLYANLLKVSPGRIREITASARASRATIRDGQVSGEERVRETESLVSVASPRGVNKHREDFFRARDAHRYRILRIETGRISSHRRSRATRRSRTRGTRRETNRE